MDSPMLAWVAIGIGALLALIALLVDPLGLGRSPGFGWVQMVGVVVGVLILLGGFYLRRRGRVSP